jgi:hypothetical protein
MGTDTVVSENVTETCHEIRNLESGRDYRFRISAEVWQPLTDDEGVHARPLGNVKKVLATLHPENTVILTWDAVDGAAEYSIEEILGSDDILVLFTVATTEAVISHLQPGIKHTYRIKSGYQNVFEAIGATVSVCNLEDMSDLQVDSLSHNLVSVSWVPVTTAQS